ncbi:hemerythrin domain-containing protein [Streptomyces huiliensis]|uniref:hemerythrin domain-containing protein n=1 Tax=Streptomyces huiliensis TaxID=2876027 RepID=UPI001CBB03CD|nr:hemerythrin domain-containing protein [Streptomyces huiliensis]MBZ4320533.1 hemerythrin domain-containing protein [Streptomyces huiliensis]
MPDRTDLVRELTAEHRAVDALFDAVRATPPGDPRRGRLAAEAAARLARHGAAEERYLYPAVRRYLPDGAAWAERLADRSRLDGVLRDLDGRAPGDPAFTGLLVALVEEATAHALEHEQRLFPRLTAACPPDVLRDLGERVRAARRAPAAAVGPAPRGSWAGRLLRRLFGMAVVAGQPFQGRLEEELGQRAALEPPAPGPDQHAGPGRTASAAK